MLTLTRREGEAIAIGTDVEVVVLGVSRGRVRLGIRAPRELAVHRAELVARIEAENKRAMGSLPPREVLTENAIRFPAGLYGLSSHKELVLCDIADESVFRALVSCSDPSVQLLVVDAAVVWPSYPVAEARKAGGFPDTEEVAIAAVATAPANGGPVTVNLMAPLVIGIASRRGVQVILERPDLGVAHVLVADDERRETASTEGAARIEAR